MQAGARLRLGSVRRLLGDLKAAEADYRAAAALFEALAAPSDRANAAQAHRRLGGLYILTGRYPEAQAELRTAVDSFDRLAAADPTDTRYRFEAVVARADAGYAHFQAGEFEAAEADDRAAAAQFGELAAADPTNALYRTERARALHNLFIVLRRTKRPAEAERTIGEAVGLLRAAAVGNRDPRVRVALGKAFQSQAAVLSDRGDFAAAEPVVREALALHAALAADFPAVPDYRHELARGQLNLGVVYSQLDRPDAVAAYRDAASTALRLADDFPSITEYRLQLARVRVSLSEVLRAGGQGKEAEALLAEALPVWEKLRADAPNAPAPLAGLVGTLATLGMMADLRGDHAAAKKHLELAEKYRAASPGLLARDPTGRVMENRLLLFLPRALVNLKNYAAAAPRADELAAIADVQGADNAFNAGCYLARCSTLAAKDQGLPAGRRAALADEYARRAVGHLRTAVARGFENAKQFATDTDLDSLRTRDDFKALLAELEKKFPPKADAPPLGPKK